MKDSFSYISQNPYRILSITSDCGARDIQKNLSKLKAFSKIGKIANLDYDLTFLNLAKIDRSEEVLSKVENKILLDKNKVQNALFWFVAHNPIDNVALNNLSNGNVDKALEIWKKITEGKEVSEKNHTAFNNLSTLIILQNLDNSKTDIFNKSDISISEIRTAMNLKNKLLTSPYFNKFAESVSKHASTVSAIEAQTYFSECILELLSKNFSSKDLIKVFNGLDKDICRSISETLLDAPINNIKNTIKNSNTKVEKDHSSGIIIGKRLIKDTLNDLKQIKDFLGKDDYQYQTIADRLANQILQCGILCYNKTQNDYEYLSSYKYALSIAFEAKTKKRANDSIKHCMEEKDANLCCSCKKNSIDKKSVYETTIYKEVSRTYNGVQYQHTVISLYFCKICFDDMNKKETYSILTIASFPILGVFISYLSGQPQTLFGFIVGGVVLGFIVKKIYFDNKKYIKEHKSMKEAKRLGWQLRQPTA